MMKKPFFMFQLVIHCFYFLKKINEDVLSYQFNKKKLQLGRRDKKLHLGRRDRFFEIERKIAFWSAMNSKS